ncbi:MAG: PEP-CTERM sorting domain-containing protein [Lentisphaeria bacterium]
MKSWLVALMGLLAVPVGAVTYSDSTGDLDPTLATDGTVDIVSMVVTNTATDLHFALTVNGNLSVTDYARYMIGIATGGTGTTTGNGWGRPISLSLDSPVRGMDFWIGSWVDSGSGIQLYSHNGSAWTELAAPGNFTITPGAQSVVACTVPLATLGLESGDSFYFDAYASGGLDTNSAWDALSNLSVTITKADEPYASTLTTGLSSYTVTGDIPEPATMAMIALGAVSVLGLRRRR